MIPISVLDLCPIVEGKDARHALDRSVVLAQRAEALGYRRFWLAEHHNMPGIASAATSIVIGHVAAATKTIRVGAGGIMLPNHAPIVIAEQFGTLATLYPGRIDLGLGRAPGTDPGTARALRRTLTGDVDDFPRDVVELMRYFEPEAGQRVHAIPGRGETVPVWILGSSTFGAQLAAVLGLPFAFASHFAPAQLDEALEIYRHRFRPSKTLDAPYVMAAVGVIAAETTAEAKVMATSLEQAFVALRSGAPRALPKPDASFVATGADRAMLDHAFEVAIVGDRDTVARGLTSFQKRTGADELMITAQIWDDEARLRSLEIAAAAAR